MSTHKQIDKICCVVLAFILVITVLFMNGKSLGVESVQAVMGYQQKIFDTSYVHSIDIIMDDWDEFIANCTDEEYTVCTVVIDDEASKNVAIRAKGNTSLTQVKSYGNDRYSFKIEFDHYDSNKTYYGLDKLCLNNIIQDNTFVKDYLTYQMMLYTDAIAPLCSFAYITVNGEDWGLYLAVESVEDSFIKRNYGNEQGELYKPDSQNMGGGRGNGKEFDMDNIKDMFDPNTSENTENNNSFTPGDTPFGNGNTPPGNMPTDGFMGERPDNVPTGGFDKDMGGNGGMDRVMGSNDVSLIYSDDEYSSYSNIFENAKTDITNKDKDRLIAALKNINENTDIESSVDIERVIRYFVVHNFVLNFDSYTGSMIHNYYLYEHDGKLSMIPWDYNLAFGGFQSAGSAQSLINYPIDTPVSGGTVDSRPMLAWIFKSDEYTQLYHQYFDEFISEYFDSGYFADMIESLKQMILPYVEKDPTKFCTYDEFIKGIDTLKEFCLLRAQSVSGQLKGEIPSTSDGQSQDSSKLISADGITISDMGSMGNNGGFEGNRGDFGDPRRSGGVNDTDETAVIDDNSTGTELITDNIELDTKTTSITSARSNLGINTLNAVTMSNTNMTDMFAGQQPPDMQENGGFPGGMPPQNGESPSQGEMPPQGNMGDFQGQQPPDMPSMGNNDSNIPSMPESSENNNSKVDNDNASNVESNISSDVTSDVSSTENPENGESSENREDKQDTSGNVTDESVSSTTQNEQGGDFNRGDKFGMRDDNGFMGDGVPTQPGDMTAASELNTWLLLGISFVILLLGLALAYFLYKERN